MNIQINKIRRNIRKYIRFGHWTCIFGVVISNEWKDETFNLGVTEYGLFSSNISTLLAFILPFFSLYLIPVSLILCYHGFLPICFRIGGKTKLRFIYLKRKPLSIKYKI